MATKTPEEMAEEIENLAILDISLMVHNDSEWHVAKKAWLAGYEAAKPKWISVKDMLPEDHCYYLVSSKKEAVSTPYGWISAGLFWDIEIAYFHQKNKTWMTGELALNCKEEDKVPFVVSHWMPLPEAPKEEK